ncbi:nucleolar protein 8-like isoform X2 [Aphelocoma coerulescens]|uniref:nucleolar protein 8-like isoform X2 n=1 Tax=Aphelocoma coerulescens TaxID=39617 RepID=UPI00360477BD
MEKEQVPNVCILEGLAIRFPRLNWKKDLANLSVFWRQRSLPEKMIWLTGNPTKTFAYISVNISDADLRKCMSILNKTKWKGGTLQIELAKESFLHRLATEREEAKLQKEKPQRNDQMCLLESLKKTGVVDFHMRAVPEMGFWKIWQSLAYPAPQESTKI